MCCFTQPVISVTNTKIFARPGKDEHQFVVYRMQLNADKNLAMVLPIPVKPGTGEQGVKFINLKEYANFFDDLEVGFPRPVPKHRMTLMSGGPQPASTEMIEVVQVGDFEASFVPTVRDFSRLDPIFQLPAGIWNKLGDYKNSGFAVFKLKAGHQDVHPMAFSFPRRNAHSLFFPTVHIHDGEVHPIADFDHTLYCQLREGQPMEHSKEHHWEESPSHARKFMKLEKSKGIIEPDEHCFKTTMHGDLPNKDTVVNLQG